jgi:hypothetical protein
MWVPGLEGRTRRGPVEVILVLCHRATVTRRVLPQREGQGSFHWQRTGGVGAHPLARCYTELVLCHGQPVTAGEHREGDLPKVTQLDLDRNPCSWKVGAVAKRPEGPGGLVRSWEGSSG